MKRKNLSKKIRRLEARLQKGANKLAKLKLKLEMAATAGTAKKKRKSGARAGKAREAVEASRSLTPQPQVKPVESVKGQGAAKKVKRKLNLTSERRAQLSAAMKARWAAKRATAAANTQNIST
jgi:hypothetical protein